MLQQNNSIHILKWKEKTLFPWNKTRIPFLNEIFRGQWKIKFEIKNMLAEIKVQKVLRKKKY